MWGAGVIIIHIKKFRDPIKTQHPRGAQRGHTPHHPVRPTPPVLRYLHWPQPLSTSHHPHFATLTGPICIKPPHTFMPIAAGIYHTGAITVYLQLGTTEHGRCDAPADLGRVIAVAAGNRHTSAVTERRHRACACAGSNLQ